MRGGSCTKSWGSSFRCPWEQDRMLACSQVTALNPDLPAPGVTAPCHDNHRLLEAHTQAVAACQTEGGDGAAATAAAADSTDCRSCFGHCCSLRQRPLLLRPLIPLLLPGSMDRAARIWYCRSRCRHRGRLPAGTVCPAEKGAAGGGWREGHHRCRRQRHARTHSAGPGAVVPHQHQQHLSTPARVALLNDTSTRACSSRARRRRCCPPATQLCWKRCPACREACAAAAAMAGARWGGDEARGRDSACRTACAQCRRQAQRQLTGRLGAAVRWASTARSPSVQCPPNSSGSGHVTARAPVAEMLLSVGPSCCSVWEHACGSCR